MTTWTEIAAGAGGFVALITAVRYIVVPLVRLGRSVDRLLDRINAVPGLRMDLHELSAAFVNLDLKRGEQIEALAATVGELGETVRDVGQVLAELDTDQGRLRRQVRENTRAIRQLMRGGPT